MPLKALAIKTINATPQPWKIAETDNAKSPKPTPI